MAKPQEKPLSKSRFKIGNSCPTKLFYSVRKEYGNKKDEDEVLRALAEGGGRSANLLSFTTPVALK